MATYNSSTSKVDFLPGVPKSRLPGTRPPKSSKKALFFRVGTTVPALLSDSSGSAGDLHACRVQVVSDAVNLYNRTPQETLGGESPHDLLYGNGLSLLASSSDHDTQGLDLRCLTVAAPASLAVNSSCVVFFVDSGAGQSLCSVGTAFSDLRPCRVEVTGVAGSLPIHGCGTASFVVHDHDGRPVIMVIPNCLYDRSEFNLLSVSQLNQVRGNRVDFNLSSPAIVLTPPSGVIRTSARIPLVIEDGLFALHVEPLGQGDTRISTLPKYIVTLRGDFTPSDSGGSVRWQTTVLAMGSPSARLLACTSEECHDRLATFCDEFLAPPSIPPARRLYDVKSQEDMAQLSIRFLGVSADRLVRTVDISNGLKPPVSKKDIRIPPLPPHVFPQGRFKIGKSPKVKKGKVGNLNHAGIAEVVFTDNFESGDSRRKYCQVFYDYVSRFGYVTTMRSKTEIGAAFADFCCQC